MNETNHIDQPHATKTPYDPAPPEFTPEQINTDPILHFFHYAHLPEKLQETSKDFFYMTQRIVMKLPRNAERTVALRKLLEAKDAAVRANLPTPEGTIVSEQEYRTTRVASEEATSFDEPIETGGHDQERDGPVPFNG